MLNRLETGFDNFGFTGQRPDNPALLDFLALRFRESGWSVKAVIREIVLSRTYRQGSGWREDAFQRDPENRLVWRIEKKRLKSGREIWTLHGGTDG